jgi:DNA ligase D
MTAEERLVEVDGQQLVVTHPNKVFFPAIEASKSDLVSYYLEVADALLNVAVGRPVLLQRFPDGAGGTSFFQKRIPQTAPTWVQSTTVSTPNGTRSNALVIADTAHVIWAVNLGCLGLHVWPFRSDDPAHADELRIDLDPQPGRSFDDVRVAAYQVRSLLDELGMTGYVKTTGSRGLHVYVGLEPRWDSYDVRTAAVALARELERRHPATMTAKWWKEERGDRVFVDFNQNAPHKTVFGAWFVRPRVGGQVSTPLDWDEIDDIDPEALTMRTVPERLRRRGDPWAGIGDAPQSLQPLLDMAARDRRQGLHDAPWPPEYPKQPDEPPRVAPSRAKKA